MPKIITNRSKQLLIISLNSGDSLHLAPGEESDPVEDYQLDNNEKVEKLKSQNLITSTSPEEIAHHAFLPSGGRSSTGEDLIVSPRTAAKRGRR